MIVLGFVAVVAGIVGIFYALTTVKTKEEVLYASVFGSGGSGFWVFGVTSIVIGALLLLAGFWGPGSSYPSQSRSPSSSRLSESSQRKLFYDLVSTQDINPDSQAWNQAAKEAAAKSYNIPMSELNNIIHEGTTNNWATPHP